MSTPHVAGLVAYILGLDSSLSPTEVETTLKNRALKDVISGVREYHPQLRRPLPAPGTETLFSFSSGNS